MRKEGLKKDSRNGSNDDDSVNAGDENNCDDAKAVNGRENGSNGNDDPLGGENNTTLDPFDALTSSSTYKHGDDSVTKRVTITGVPDDEEDDDQEEKVNGDDEDDNEGDEVEDIIDHKYKGKTKNKKLYLIRWKGYGAEDDTWQPEESLDCPEIVDRYLELHPDERPPKKPKKEKKEKKVKDSPLPVPRDTPRRTASAQVSFSENSNLKGDEVEAILDHKVVKNEKLYKISWKGFSANQDSWEPASALDCDDLIAEYEANDKAENKKDSKKGKKGKKGGKVVKKGPPKNYEVEKVVDDKMVGGKKHYRIRWKGYAAKDDTWEPSSMLNCSELIKAYQKQKKEEEEEEEEEADYEVEKIIGDKTERGKKFYLVKWKGYSEDESTWEPEASLSCADLLKKYNTGKASPAKGKKRPAKAAGLSKKKGGAKKARRPGPKSRRGAKDSDDDDDEEDEVEYESLSEGEQDDEQSEEEVVKDEEEDSDAEKEWEVQDIMDMRTVKGDKQYLIRWKGCKPSEDTWEPEEQVNCPAIVEKFLKKNSDTKSKAKKSKRA